MEEKIQVIKNNLIGDFSKDMEFLNSLYNEEINIIEDAKTTIEAINIVIEELNKVKEDEEKKFEEANKKIEDKETKNEIDAMIDELFAHIDQESTDDAINSIENIIPKIESLTKSDDNIMYCSFSSEYERILFEKLFAGEKKVVPTPYANDTLYIMYADLLLKKKKKTAAMEALERAIYWNFLNRTAREKKLDIYFQKKEIVKYLESLKSLQMISYNPVDIADCYNKYGYVFNSLKDVKSSYAMYRLSYSYYKSENVEKILQAFEELDPTLIDMTSEQIMQIAADNEVLTEANTKIIKVQRDIAKDFIENGMIDEAKMVLENDYALTGDEQIANIYNQLLELEKAQNALKEENNDHPKKKKVVKKSTKSTTTRKVAPKKNSTKAREENNEATKKNK